MGGLIKRLDTGEGSYAKELEEDYAVAEQLDAVICATMGCIGQAEALKKAFTKYEFLWQQDVGQALMVCVYGKMGWAGCMHDELSCRSPLMAW